MRIVTNSLHRIGSGFIVLFFLLLLAAQPAFAEDTVGEDTPPVVPAAGSTPSIFGIQTYGSTAQGSKYHNVLLETGTTWVRVPFYWRLLEPADRNPANYNWASIDAAVGVAAVSDQYLIILTMELAPSWITTNADGPFNFAMIDDFVEMITAVVERYDGDGVDDAPGSPIVSYFEIYNEPDGWCNGNRRWGHAGAQYAELLKAIYAPIKAANAKAQVVLGGIAFDWFQTVNSNLTCTPVAGWPFSNSGAQFSYNFLEDVLKAGGGDYFDVMNFHTYPSFGKNWTTNTDAQRPNNVFDVSLTNQLSIGLLEKTIYVRKLLGSYGYGGKPIVITEAGIGSDVTGFESSGDTPQKLQSEHVVAFFAQAKAADLKAMIWWTLFDASPEYLMGLVDTDVVKKDSFAVYQTAVDELSQAVYEVNLTYDTGYPLRVGPYWLGYGDDPQYHTADSVTLEAYRFSDPAKNRIVYVAWLNPLRGEPPARTLKLWAQAATVKNMYGSVIGNYTDAGDGNTDWRVEIPVSGEPLYIEVAAADDIQFRYLPMIVGTR